MTDLTLPDWIRPRSDWGARPPLRPLTYDRMPWARLWAHHTAGSMWSTPLDVQYQHQIANGWRDAAYNFYVRLLRTGAVEVGELLPLGARHLNSDAGNSGTILWVGNFDTAQVPDAMVEAGARLVAHGVLAGWWSDQVRDEPHLTGGHRDIPGAKPTACPGRHLHARIGDVNAIARQMILDLQEDDMAAPPKLGKITTAGKVQWWIIYESGLAVPISASDANFWWANGKGLEVLPDDVMPGVLRSKAKGVPAG